MEAKMEFKLKADITFDAESAEDAYRQISMHFSNLEKVFSDKEEYSDFSMPEETWFLGSIAVAPTDA